jgi:multimeric flavodoxin WrbA
MSILIIDGGPRKNWNTAQLLDKVAEGVVSAGGETLRYRLYDHRFKGCVSCFACKRKGIFLDCCAQKDDLHPILKEAHKADAIVLGSPFYFGEITGISRMFIERMFFPYLGHYDKKPSSYGRKIKFAFVYAMNAFPEEFDRMHMTPVFERYDELVSMLFGEPIRLMATETLQFDDYSKYQTAAFDADYRVKRHETVFPEDLRKAFELGASLVF